MQIKKLIKSNKFTDNGLLIIPKNIEMDGNYNLIYLEYDKKVKLAELLHILSDDILNDKMNVYNKIICSIMNGDIFILKYYKNPLSTSNNIFQESLNSTISEGINDSDMKFFNFQQFDILDDKLYFFISKDEKIILDRLKKIKKMKNNVI